MRSPLAINRAGVYFSDGLISIHLQRLKRLKNDFKAIFITSVSGQDDSYSNQST